LVILRLSDILEYPDLELDELIDHVSGYKDFHIGCSKRCQLDGFEKEGEIQIEESSLSTHILPRIRIKDYGSSYRNSG